MSLRKTLLCATVCVSAALLAAATAVQAKEHDHDNHPGKTGSTAPADIAWTHDAADRLPTATPIKHIIIIYDENVSFDHYFATYPQAANPSGEPKFTAQPHTPQANTLVSANLLTNNPNYTNTANGAGCRQPLPPGSHPGRHGRPEPRLHRRAGSL